MSGFFSGRSDLIELLGSEILFIPISALGTAIIVLATDFLPLLLYPLKLGV